MAHLKKLSAFRQLSLGCESSEQRRRSFKKQFSEDLADSRIGIKIALNSKARNLISAPPIKIAWGDDPVIKTNDAVIVRKCQENARAPGKLSRQASLEKDSSSILNSKQDIANRLQEKEQEKPNLRIFLAHNSKEHYLEEQNVEKLDQPKIIPPLVGNVSSRFHIRRTPKANLNETTYTPTSNTVVVVPIVEASSTEEVKPIDSVVIRPATAASRRDNFQKRTNSAFHATIKETPNPRPTLVRSSSAPSKPDHNRSKFLATKRKIKTAKRTQAKCNAEDNDQSPKSLNGTDVITMVSLVSPAGSDCDEEAVETQQKEKERCRSPKKNPKTVGRDEKEAPKILSLRKTVKSVSFQQSSIHAVRSFSASFPGRRASVAAALTMNANAHKTSATTVTPSPAKLQEKRGSITAMPDDDERTPKRKLLQGDRESGESKSCDKPEEDGFNDYSKDENQTESRFSVDIKEKTDIATAEIRSSDSENCLDDIQKIAVAETSKNDTYESPKEKQCWNMYCKMTQKGINVSFDTILRGMLTPTEYRMSRRKVAPNDNTQNVACETK